MIDEMRLNSVGRIVEEEWLRTPGIRKSVELDMYVVMPNHVHGVIERTCRGDPAGRPYEGDVGIRFARRNHWAVQIKVRETNQ